MPLGDPERLHKNCPSCQCESRKLGRVVLYPPNRILHGECPACGKVRWISEIWTYRDGSWNPLQREHCGCCDPGCPTHSREALGGAR